MWGASDKAGAQAQPYFSEDVRGRTFELLVASLREVSEMDSCAHACVNRR